MLKLTAVYMYNILHVLGINHFSNIFFVMLTIVPLSSDKIVEKTIAILAYTVIRTAPGIKFDANLVLYVDLFDSVYVYWLSFAQMRTHHCNPKISVISSFCQKKLPFLTAKFWFVFFISLNSDQTYRCFSLEPNCSRAKTVFKAVQVFPSLLAHTEISISEKSVLFWDFVELSLKPVLGFDLTILIAAH